MSTSSTAITKMRLVDLHEGALELNYMWLPTWLGMNTKLKKEMEADLAEKFIGRTSDELDAINYETLQYIANKFPIPGLADYLDGLKFIGQTKG